MLPAIIFASLLGLAPTAFAQLTVAQLDGLDRSQAGNTENELVNGSCADLVVIFARGTSESGNVGDTTGPPFFQALNKQAGEMNVVLQGVDYPADAQGFLAGGDQTGSQRMVNLTQQAFAQCPGSKVTMSGYSQEGQLVHNAAKLLPASTMQNISSVVIFGDPDNGTAVANAQPNRVLVICHQGDDSCPAVRSYVREVRAIGSGRVGGWMLALRDWEKGLGKARCLLTGWNHSL